jgi:prepilin-type N-terminal cleavage/methylation domain-containing protein
VDFRRPNAFTFVELLISVLIVGVMALFFTRTLGYGGRAASRALCLQQLQSLGGCLRLYAADHSGSFPAVDGAATSDVPLALLTPKYCSDPALFFCPGSESVHRPGLGESVSGYSISYAYVMGHTMQSPPQSLLAADALIPGASLRRGEPLFAAKGSGPGANHGSEGGALLLVNGSVLGSPLLADRTWALPPRVKLVNPKP